MFSDTAFAHADTLIVLAQTFLKGDVHDILLLEDPYPRFVDYVIRASLPAPSAPSAPTAVVTASTPIAPENGAMVVDSPAQAPPVPARDPMLEAFEAHLLKNLRETDVAKDEDGIYLFNVNQVAYLVEGSNTEEKQKTTRNRIKDTVKSLNTKKMRCKRSGQGKHAIFFI